MYDYESMSLSAWRAWIEILLKATTHQNFTRRSPLGERGLKSNNKLSHEELEKVALRLESVD